MGKKASFITKTRNNRSNNEKSNNRTTNKTSSKVRLTINNSKLNRFGKPKKKFGRKTDFTSKPKTLKNSKLLAPKTNKSNLNKSFSYKENEDQIYLIETENKLFNNNENKEFYNVSKEEENNLIDQATKDEWLEYEKLAEADLNNKKLNNTSNNKNSSYNNLINNNSNNMVNLHDLVTKQMNDLEDPTYDPKTIQGFKDLGTILSTWTSGKLPKLFGVLPNLEEWKLFIDYTNPLGWTPNAMYEATFMFTSNLNNTLIEDFFKLYLVPYIRNNIKRYHKLNIHLYNSLKKAIYKPAGFFKGIVFPMAENLTAKEANILGSILSKCSIPVAHSSSAIMMLFELNNKEDLSRVSHGHLFFIKILLSKKYALPTIVKSGIVNNFYNIAVNNLKQNIKKLPLIFHQCLLVFVETYKFDLDDEEKKKIRYICEKFNHHIISNLVTKELNFK